MKIKSFRSLTLSVCLLALAATVCGQELRRAGFVGVRAGQLTDEARARPHFAGEGVVVLGVEAPLVAQQVPVKGLVVVNTVAKPFLEYLMDTRRRQNMLRRVPFDEMERRLMLNEQCNHRLLIERETPEQLLKEMPSCGDYIAYPAPYTFMQQWAALIPAEEWKKVDAPVLVLYGTSDFVSTIADDPYLADLINSFHPGRATLKAVSNMDHYMTRAASMEESMNRAAGARAEFEPALLEAIKDWLRQQVSQTRQPLITPRPRAGG